MSNFKLAVILNVSWLGCAATSANEYLNFPLGFLAEDLTKYLRSLNVNYWPIIDWPEKQYWVATMVSSLEARISPSDCQLLFPKDAGWSSSLWKSSSIMKTPAACFLISTLRVAFLVLASWLAFSEARRRKGNSGLTSCSNLEIKAEVTSRTHFIPQKTLKSPEFKIKDIGSISFIGRCTFN